MNKTLYIKTIVTSTGERLPMLLNKDTGIPLELPTLYTLQMLRAKNRSSSTIEQSLRSILIFKVWLSNIEIDLNDRLTEGDLFTLVEVQDLIYTCNLLVSELNRPSNVHTLASTRPPLKSTATRLKYIRDYIDWRVDNFIQSTSLPNTLKTSLLTKKATVLQQIESRTPTQNRKTTFDNREGLSKEHVELIQTTIAPGNDANPWHGTFAKSRNELIIQWLLTLGLRRGELLNIKVSDINFKKNTVQILRRADDPKDPRVQQPNVKTRDRELPMSDTLVQTTKNYILNVRAKTKTAKKHEFLFVSSGAGAPLTLVALNKVFEVLRSASPELPKHLSPHVLRHTWNDTFSELADSKKLSGEDEQKMRSYLMGWSETSGTAAIYTRRHVKEAAKTASLELQNVIQGVANV